MTKYLFLYRNPPSGPQKQPSPEEMQQMMKQWTDWKEKYKAHVVDMGDGLKPDGRTVTASGVTDGPFAESKELIGGFSIVEAKDYEQALEVAKACPITFVPDYSIEIREMMGY